MSVLGTIIEWVAYPVYGLNKYLWNRLFPKTPAAPQIPGRPAQVAAFGKSLPIVWGKTRVTGGLLYLSDEYTRTIVNGPASSTQPGRDCIIALCEGEITGIGLYWWDRFATSISLLEAFYAGVVKTGTLTQAAWTFPPAAKQLVYPGIAYVAFFCPSESLGGLPQQSYEVQGLRYGSGNPDTGDADPADVVTDLLTDATFGARVPFAVEVDLGQDDGTGATAAASYRRYVTEEGLWISPAITDPRPAVQHLEDILTATNSTAIWTGSTLKIIPLGDTAKGTYTPVATVQYALTRSLLPGPNGVELAADSDVFNIAPVEFLDRSPAAATTDPAHAYNVAVVEDPDPVDVAQRGERRAATAQMYAICERDVALKLARIRAQVMVHARNRHKFPVPWNVGARLEPMDYVSRTEPRLGLSGVVVRIETIEEDENHVYSVEAIEVPEGAAYAVAHTVSSSDGPTSFTRDPVGAARYALAAKNWTPRTIPAGTYRAVAWNGTTLCAVGDSGVVATSIDGTTWTARTGAGTNGRAVAWNGSVFCAVGMSGTYSVQTSPDGVTWTGRTAPNGGTAIAWNGSVFVAVSGSTCMTSPTGTTWTARTIPAGTYYDVAWNGSAFCAVGSVSAISPDGITWTGHTLPTPTRGGTYVQIAWNGSVFCAVGLDRESATSIDGVNWELHDMPLLALYGGSYFYPSAIAWTGSVFVATQATASAATPVYVSYDGANWAVHPYSMPGNASSGDRPIVWADTFAVAVGANFAGTSLAP